QELADQPEAKGIAEEECGSVVSSCARFPFSLYGEVFDPFADLPRSRSPEVSRMTSPRFIEKSLPDYGSTKPVGGRGRCGSGVSDSSTIGANMPPAPSGRCTVGSLPTPRIVWQQSLIVDRPSVVVGLPTQE